MPHYLLKSSVSRTQGDGRWQFLLLSPDGKKVAEVEDFEPDVWGERLDLLTVIRALESLDQPSRVTLVGCTRYVRHGIEYGLAEWRENDWRWECFGQMSQVRDADLWLRMDRALQFHRVECVQRRFDSGHGPLAGPHNDNSMQPGGNWLQGIANGSRLVQCCLPVVGVWCAWCLDAVSRFWHATLHAFTGCNSSFIIHRS